MIRTIGIGLYGSMYGHRGHGKTIPGRLRITSAEINVLRNEPIIAGVRNYTITAAAEGDYICVKSLDISMVEEYSSVVRVTGDHANTVYAEDYLSSQKTLYGDFLDDGLLIWHSADAEFGSEKVKI